MADYMEVEEGSYFDIPIGALQSVNIEICMGRRIVSSEEAAFAAVRVMGTCFATGHAAGVGAAVQARTGQADIEEIRRELLEAKCIDIDRWSKEETSMTLDEIRVRDRCNRHADEASYL
mgnify:CR=1 FL=1